MSSRHPPGLYMLLILDQTLHDFAKKGPEDALQDSCQWKLQGEMGDRYEDRRVT